MTPDRFDQLMVIWLARFHDRKLCVEQAQEYVRTAIVPDEHRFSQWMQRALDKDQIAARAAALEVSTELADVTRTSAFQLDSQTAAHAIAAGDLHDFAHPQTCPRCHQGIQSREAVDERARRLGKTPFPTLGDAFIRRQRNQLEPSGTAPRPHGYQLAIAQGFEGTLEEWVAIVSHRLPIAEPPPHNEPGHADGQHPPHKQSDPDSVPVHAGSGT